MIKDIISESLSPKIESKSLKELFEEKLELSGLSKTQFEKLSNLQRRSLDGILEKTSKQTDVVNLLKVGEFLDLDLRDLFIYHFMDRSIEEIKELQDAIEISYIHKVFDIKTLSALGFIDNNASISSLKERICNFFQLNSIYEYAEEFADVLYSRTKKSYSDKMKDFWIKASYKYFELIDNPNDYSREDLIVLIPKIKPYTQNVNQGLLIVFRALYNVGVTVVFQPSLPKTQIRGATFLIKGKPCIVITDLNKNYATIWFALIHELHHVLYDLVELEKINYHLTGEPDLFLLQEDKANEFSSEYLFSSEKMRFIIPLIHNKLVVENFAKKCQVHPSIIYSQFQYSQTKLGNNYWGAFKEFFPDVTEATKQLNVSHWNTESLKVAAENVKRVLSV